MMPLLAWYDEERIAVENRIEQQVRLLNSPDRHEVSWTSPSGWQVEWIDQIIEGALSESLPMKGK